MSERIYRWLLRFYPARFRAEYGEEMLQLFRDRMRKEPELRVWADVLPDAAISIPREHWRRPVRAATATVGYRIPEEWLDRMVWRGHVREAPVLVLCLAAGLAIAWLGDAPRLVACAVYAVLALPIAMPLVSIRRYKDRWRHLELLIDGDRIQQCERGRVTLSLERDEITRIIETRAGGIAIQTADPRRALWIPALMNGYAELRARLAEWAPLEEEELDRRMVNGHSRIQWLIALYPAALLTRSAAVAIPLAIVMGAYVVRFAWRFFKRPTVPRAVWLLPAVLLALLAAKVGYLLRWSGH